MHNSITVQELHLCHVSRELQSCMHNAYLCFCCTPMIVENPTDDQSYEINGFVMNFVEILQRESARLFSHVSE